MEPSPPPPALPCSGREGPDSQTSALHPGEGPGLPAVKPPRGSVHVSAPQRRAPHCQRRSGRESPDEQWSTERPPPTPAIPTADVLTTPPASIPSWVLDAKNSVPRPDDARTEPHPAGDHVPRTGRISPPKPIPALSCFPKPDAPATARNGPEHSWIHRFPYNVHINVLDNLCWSYLRAPCFLC